MSEAININLVTAAMYGDETAFRELYNQTYRDKYYIALKYMKNETEAEDVIQEAYVKIWQNLPGLTNPEYFSTWSGRIVANTAISALRKKQPVLFSDLETEDCDGSELLYEVADESIANQPELSFTQNEEQQLVREIIDSLSDEQRMCILMFHIENLSIKEIAETIGCSENTVKSRLNYGRKNIKDKVEELQKKGYDFKGISALALLLMLIGKEALSLGVKVPVQSAKYMSAASYANGTINGMAAGSGAGEVSQTVAKTTFLKTAAGKIVLTFAGLAVIGGIGAAILLNKNSDKPHKLEVDTATGDELLDTAVEDVSDTATGSDATGIVEELIDTEPLLRKYLEEKLIPEKGVYNTLQSFYYTGYGDFIRYDYTYNEMTHEIIASSYGYDDVEDFETDKDANPYDYNGIYACDIYDYDGDGQQEMLIISGTASGIFDDEGYTRDIIAELYDVRDGNVYPVASAVLNCSPNEDTKRPDSVSRIEEDGNVYLLIKWSAKSGGVDFSERYALICPAQNMEYRKMLTADLNAGQNEDTNEWFYYVNILDKDFISGVEDGTTLDFQDGFSESYESFLKEHGYKNETTVALCADSGRIEDYTGFAEKYLFNYDKSDEGIDDISDTASNLKVFESVANEELRFWFDPQDSATFKINSDGSFQYQYDSFAWYNPPVEYHSAATGSFVNPEKIDDFTYKFITANVVDVYTPHTEESTMSNTDGEDIPMTIGYESATDEVNGTFYLYLPGKPIAELPKDVVIGEDASWVGALDYISADNKLNCFVLYREGDNFAYSTHVD